MLLPLNVPKYALTISSDDFMSERKVMSISTSSIQAIEKPPSIKYSFCELFSRRRK